MRQKKGAALITAIALCTILLIISMAVGTFVIELSTVNKINDIKSTNRIYYDTYANRFVSGDDAASFPTDKVNWEVKTNGNIKGLIARSKTEDKIVFYTIYDFTKHEYLAYQYDEVYIKDNKLGGILPLGE